MSGLLLRACPRCHGALTVDGYERDGALCCLSCGHVAWPARTLAASQASAAVLAVALRHRKHGSPQLGD
jgi:hypothetical protein